MSVGGLFFGEDHGRRIFAAERGSRDGWSGAGAGGSTYDMVAESAELAPAGEAGECAFLSLWLTVTHSAAAVLRLTPIVDGAEQEEAGADVLLAALDRRRTAQLPEILVRLPARRPDDSVWGVFAPRGARIGVRIESVGGLGDGDLVIDSVALDYEVVQESRG